MFGDRCLQITESLRHAELVHFGLLGQPLRHVFVSYDDGLSAHAAASVVRWKPEHATTRPASPAKYLVRQLRLGPCFTKPCGHWWISLLPNLSICIHLYQSIFIYIYLYLSMPTCMHLYVPRSISIPISISVSISISISIVISVFLSLSLSLALWAGPQATVNIGGKLRGNGHNPRVFWFYEVSKFCTSCHKAFVCGW